ncbi:MAG TPA: response regulator [Acidobacteriaceae bacterium]|nr:response regulator [Acidobacteriaceae bacterium]
MRVVGRTKVLIVDDEPAVADTLAMVFRINGYEVQVAYSAEDGIETIAAWEPNLAVIDVMLPGMNGIDFAIVLKENRSHCEVLLFSGYESTGPLLEAAAKKGYVFEIVAKPMHPVEILDVVESLLAENSRGRGRIHASQNPSGA